MSKLDSLSSISKIRQVQFEPAVVGNMSYSGLGLARALGRHGVPVIAISPKPDAIGMNSRFVTPVTCPDVGSHEHEFLEFLEHLGERLGRKSVFFPTGDSMVLFLARNQERLQTHYEFVMPETKLVRQVVGKESIFELCSQHRIPVPRTICPTSSAEMENAVKEIGFPCIIKPILSPQWWDKDIARITDGGKVVNLNSLARAKEIYEELSPLDTELVVQEIIPGDDKCLFYLVCYIDRQGTLLTTFAGQKLRLTPAHFGSASYVKSIYDPDLEEIGIKLLDAIGYIGLCGIEFKLDPRDDTYKLIEFNARFGLWDILATKCGIDLPWIAYRDALRLPVQKSNGHQNGVIWLSLARDLRAFRQYNREGVLSLYQWLSSLRGKKCGASFAWDDPRPGISEAFAFLRDGMSVLLKSRR